MLVETCQYNIQSNGHKTNYSSDLMLLKQETQPQKMGHGKCIPMIQKMLLVDTQLVQVLVKYGL
jgi:hypothetical protein